MKDDLMKTLKDAGFDTEGTLERFGGSKEMYEEFLNTFLKDQTFETIKPAFDKNDKEEALNTTHTLKGVSGNLGMTRLYKACCNTVELIRADEFEKARESYGELEAAYEETCNLIK